MVYDSQRIMRLDGPKFKVLLSGMAFALEITKKKLMATSFLFLQVLDEIGVDVASQVGISCH